MKIKRTIEILLAICFLVSITAIAVSADGANSGKGWGGGFFVSCGPNTNWNNAQLNQYENAKSNYFNLGKSEGQQDGDANGYSDYKNGKTYDKTPRTFKPCSGINPEPAGSVDGYNEGYQQGYQSNLGYDAGWYRAKNEMTSQGSSGSSSNLQPCQGPVPSCKGGKVPACVYGSFGSSSGYWKCVKP